MFRHIKLNNVSHQFRKFSSIQKHNDKIQHKQILKSISTYLWPKDSMEDKIRVTAAVGLMITSKIVNVQVPLFFKNIIDTMNIDITDNTLILPLSLIHI